MNNDIQKKEDFLNKQLYLLYLSYIMQKDNIDFFDYKKAINSIEDINVKKIVVDEVFLEEFKKVYKKYSLEELKNKINSFNDRFYEYYETPTIISLLSAKILKINKNDIVADLCCGTGSFARNLYKYNVYTGNNIVGYEINEEYVAIGSIKNEINNIKTKIIIKDIFDNSLKNRFDKIFCDYPLNIIDEKYKESIIAKLQNSNPRINDKISSSWIYNIRILELLNKGGKAIALMCNGDLSNRVNKSIKEYFIDNGFIETIIDVPKSIAKKMQVNHNIVVLSKNNEKVNFVNLEDDCLKKIDCEKDINKKIEEIMYLIEKNKSISTSRTIKEIRESDYEISPQKVLKRNIILKNPIKLKDVLDDLTRGVNLSKEELDKIITSEKTNYKFVTINDIQDGLINDNLINLKEIDKRYGKYCANNGDVLISKSGNPIKIAVCDFDYDLKVLVSNNIFILKLNDKMDPYYLQAFLNSDKGRNILSREYEGNIISIITAANLKELLIEDASKYVQSTIHNRQVDHINRLKRIRQEFEQLKEDEKNIFNEV